MMSANMSIFLKIDMFVDREGLGQFVNRPMDGGLNT